MNVALPVIRAADLFCGAGGSSTGALAACRDLGFSLDLTAVNHWPTAIESHSASHPEAVHYCEDLAALDPIKAVPGGHLHLLVASPECTHHSNARGGKPMAEQSRASAWHVLRWAAALRIDNILVENVPEWEHWCALGENGRPLKSQRGRTFRAWVAALRALDYRVDWRVLNAADYGDATTRKRLFVIARRGRRKIVWPEPSHAPKAETDLFSERPRWRAAREIIDWKLPGKSIFGRKKPLSANTMRRIIAGLRRFGGAELEPFIVQLNGTGGRHGNLECTARSAAEPLPTITGGGNHLYLAEPFLLPNGGARRINTRLHTDSPKYCCNHCNALYEAFHESCPVCLRGAVGHVLSQQAFVIGQQSCAAPRAVSEPLPTVAGAGAIAVVEPFLVPFFGERDGQSPRTHSPDEPLPAVTGQGAGALIEPFIVEYRGSHAGQSDGDGRVKSLDAPLPTQTCDNRFGLAQPFIVQTDQTGSKGGCARSIDQPIATVVSKQNAALIEPHLVKFYGRSSAASVDDPLDTITARDRFGLVMPTIRAADGQTLALDIRFRMLQPHELAAAMSFPPGYVFRGNREAQVKQIGNAVPVQLSRALIHSLLQNEAL